MISLSTSAPRKVSTRSILRQPTQAPKWCQCLSEPALSHPSRRKRQLQPFASTLVPPGPGAPMHVCDHLGGSQGEEGRVPPAPEQTFTNPACSWDPHAGETLLRFRWGCHEAERRGCRAERHHLLRLRSRFGIALCWVCESATRPWGFFPSRTSASISFFTSPTPESLKVWVQGAPH